MYSSIVRRLTISCLLSLALCRAAIVAAPSSTTNYDFVIVGGGTAGNVLANRLSENFAWNVLLLEAGQSDEGVIDVAIPFMCSHVTPNTPYDWNYTTTPQVGFRGRSIPYARGHILGGSSSVNFLMHTRGSRDDWNRYAKVTGDSGWSWNNMQTYFRKNERFQPPVDGHKIAGQFDPSIHGFDGMVANTLSGFPTPINGRIIDAINQLKGIQSFVLDYNSGNGLGIGWLQYNANGPSRDSSATSYLAANFLWRPNLHVVLGAQVSRILQTGTVNGVPAFQSVEYRIGTGALQTVSATKEVILSAGSVGSPHILLNSGIGPSNQLKSVGITPIVDHSGIGANLTDHPVLFNAFSISGTGTFDEFERNMTLQQQEIVVWERTGKGPLTNTVASHVGFMRLPANHSIFQTIPDPSAGPTSGHHESIFSNGVFATTPSGNFLGIATAVVSPAARGTITLASNDPFAAPRIDPGLLNSDFDRTVMREAVRLAVHFTTAHAWAGYVIGPTSALATVLNSTNQDAALDTYIAEHAQSIWHPVGTASMSPIGASYGVVDPDLKMKKVARVRIVDASVFPYIPSMHTAVPTYVVAERASDLIKLAWLY